VSIAAAILKPLSFGERCQDRSAEGGSEKRGIWRTRSAAYNSGSLYYSAEANLSEEFSLTALHNLRSADRSRQAVLLNGRDAREMVVVAVSGSYLRVLATQALVASQEAQSNMRRSRTSRRSIRRTRAPKPRSMPTAALSKCRHSNGLAPSPRVRLRRAGLGERADRSATMR
jgi:hypothetical protein